MNYFFIIYLKRISILRCLSMGAFMVITIFGFSQNRVKINTLLRRCNIAENDTGKARIYLDISDEFWTDMPDSCLKYTNLSLQLAKKYNHHGLLYHGYLNYGAVYSACGKIKEALYYDQLSFREALLSGKEKYVLSICMNYGDDLNTNSQFDSALTILDLGIKIAKETNSKTDLVKFYINKSANFFYSGKTDSVEKYLLEGLKYALELKDSADIALYYNNIASVRLSRGIADSLVIRYLMMAISIHEKSKNYLKLGDSYNSLAGAHNINGSNRKCIYYMKKGVEAFEKARNETKTIIILVNIADQYRELKIPDSADYYVNLAIQRGEQYQYPHGLLSAYCMKGELLNEQRNYTLAEHYLKKAYSEYTRLKDMDGVVYAGNKLTTALIKQNKLKEAAKTGLVVFNLASSNKDYNALKIISMSLADVYSKLGNYSDAYHYQAYYISASDTITKRENKRLMEEMTAKYETEKKDKAILLLKADTLVHQARIIQQSKWIYEISTIATIIIIVIMIFLYINQRKKVQYKMQLEKLEISFLRSQLKPHFLCNALQAIRNFIRFNPERAEEYLDKYSSLMREVLVNTETDSITMEEEFSMLKKYMDLESLRITNGFTYDLNIDSRLDSEILKVPPLILQPIVENAIWHGIAGHTGKGKISIHVSKDKEMLVCSVKDQCSGKVEETVPSKGKRKSYGLKISRERLRLLSKERGGKWYLDLIPQHDGMNVNIGIPL